LLKSLEKPRKCQNDNCEHAYFCTIRSQGETATESNRPDADPAPGPSFKIVDHDIGRLDIVGSIGKTSTDAAVAMLQGLKRIQGLLVTFDSGGGNAWHGDFLYDALRYARERVPVYGLVRKALSAACTAAVGCTKVFAKSEESLFGCMGCVASWCDGSRPQIICSELSPNKVPADGYGVSITEFCPYEDWVPYVQQQQCDRRYYIELVKLSRERGVPEDVLLDFADGTVFETRGARYYDLVDGVLNEEKALIKLKERIKNGTDENFQEKRK
jgi:ClpP class serine protease